TVKNEDWKYTNVQPLVNQAYALEADTLSGGSEAWNKALIPDLDAHRVVLVNGQYSSELSSPEEIPGLQIMPIEQAFERLCFAKYFTAYADKTDNPFVALNTASFTSGLFIEVSKNCQLRKPVHVIHVAASANPLFSQTRNLY